MKHLYTFNEGSVRYLGNIEEIRQCFIYFDDNMHKDPSGVRVKRKGQFRQYSPLSSKIFRNNNSDYEVTIIPELDEYRDGYRKNKFDKSFVDEIKYSVSMSSGYLNLKLDAFVIEYIRNLDYDNGEEGRGVVNRVFIDGGSEPEYIMLYKNKDHYDIKEVYNFLNFLNDKVRYVKIYFSEIQTVS